MVQILPFEGSGMPDGYVDSAYGLFPVCPFCNCMPESCREKVGHVLIETNCSFGQNMPGLFLRQVQLLFDELLYESDSPVDSQNRRIDA